MVTFNILPDATGRFSWTGAGSLNERYSQAVVLYHSGEKVKAIASLKEMYQENPAYFYIAEFIGSYYMENDHPGLAMDYLYQAVWTAEAEIPKEFYGVIPWNYIENRAYLSALYNLGMINFATHRYAESIKHFRKLLIFEPEDKNGIRHIMGDIYFHAGNLDEAEFSYRQNMKYPHIRYSLGLLKLAQQKNIDSVYQFCRAIVEDDGLYMLHSSGRLQRSGNFQRRIDAIYYSTYSAELWLKYEGGPFLKKIFESKTFQVRYHRIKQKQNQLNDILLDSRKQRARLRKEINELISSMTHNFAQKILNEIDPG